MLRQQHLTCPKTVPKVSRAGQGSQSSEEPGTNPVIAVSRSVSIVSVCGQVRELNPGTWDLGLGTREWDAGTCELKPGTWDTRVEHWDMGQRIRSEELLHVGNEVGPVLRQNRMSAVVHIVAEPV